MTGQEISMALASVKTALEIVKTIRNVSQKVEFQEQAAKLYDVTVSIQSDLLVMQQDYSNLLKIKDNLEQKLSEYENWDDEKTNYELREIPPGIKVYVYKKGEGFPGPEHWLCTNCYSDNKKSIIQFGKTMPSWQEYFCPRCKMEFQIPQEPPDIGGARITRGSDYW